MRSRMAAHPAHSRHCLPAPPRRAISAGRVTCDPRRGEGEDGYMIGAAPVRASWPRLWCIGLGGSRTRNTCCVQVLVVRAGATGFASVWVTLGQWLPPIGRTCQVLVVGARLSRYQLALDVVPSRGGRRVFQLPGCKPLIGGALAWPVAPARSLPSANRGCVSFRAGIASEIAVWRAALRGGKSEGKVFRAKAWILRGLRANTLPGTPGASILQMKKAEGGRR